jgi:hypothetical protein
MEQTNIHYGVLISALGFQPISIISRFSTILGMVLMTV